MRRSESPAATGSLAMSDTTNPGLTKATRRFGAGRPKVAPFARFEGTSAWRKDRRRVRAYARFRAAAKQASQDTKILSALDDRGGRDAAEPGRKRNGSFCVAYGSKPTPLAARAFGSCRPKADSHPRFLNDLLRWKGKPVSTSRLRRYGAIRKLRLGRAYDSQTSSSVSSPSALACRSRAPFSSSS